jgi:hypothetical protein
MDVFPRRCIMVSSKRAICVIVVIALALITVPPSSTRVSAQGNPDWTRIAANGLGNKDFQGAWPVGQFKDRVFLMIPVFGSLDEGEFPAAPLWAYDGTDFRKAADDGFGDDGNKGVYPNVVYEGCLYAGTTKKGGGQVRRTSDGVTWSKNLFPHQGYDTCIPLGVQNGELLVGCYSMDESRGATAYSFDGSSFRRASPEGFGYDADIVSYGATYDGEVHAAVFSNGMDTPCVPLVYRGGRRWEPTAKPGFGNPDNLASYILSSDGIRLYAGTVNFEDGGECLAYDGDSWSRLGSNGIGNPANDAVFAFGYKGRVLAATTRFGKTGGPVGPASIYRQKPDGGFEQWTNKGFGDGNNIITIPTAAFRGDFIAGTFNEDHGFQVWSTPIPMPDTYYFAEGTTRDNPVDGSFEEWVCIQNPNDEAVKVTVTYMMGAGTDTVRKDYGISANSRFTINVAADVGADRDVSVKVVGSDSIVAERPMYFNYHGRWTGGHVVMGVPNPRKSWYFAEGTTRDNPADGSFDEWVCIQNPGPEDADVTITYMLEGGGTDARRVEIPAGTRHTQSVNKDLGPNVDASVKVQSDVPVVAERPMYFNYHGMWTGGHDAVGAPEPSTELYFAEGTTRSWNQEWICIQNPNDEDATVTVGYQVEGGNPVTRSYTVEATGRRTVDVAADVGPERDVSVSLSSDLPVVAERPMYFNYQGKWPGGHNVMGATSPRLRYYFAEGTTRDNPTDGSFDEWICLQNPGNAAAGLTIYLMETDGKVTSRPERLDASARKTLSVNEIVGPDRDVSIYVESDEPIVAERPMYFNYHGVWPGGSDTAGASY